MKIACFDLETTDLSGDYGRCLAGSIYSYPDDEMTTYLANPDRVWDDRTVIRQIRDKLNEHHLLVGWYIKGFDLPYLNTRLLDNRMNKLDRKFIVDLCFYFRGWYGLKPSSSKLSTVVSYLKKKEQKDHIDQELWAKARAGHSGAIDRVGERCESDVRLTWSVYWEIIDEYIGKIERYGQ